MQNLACASFCQVRALWRRVRAEIQLFIPPKPKSGVIFRDISPLLASPADFSAVIDQMAKEVSELHFDTIVALESRGFVFGAPLAVKLTRAKCSRWPR
jgi:adenine/guanine phosphoribosyltransferase-like PRPP-binding protein